MVDSLFIIEVHTYCTQKPRQDVRNNTQPKLHCSKSDLHFKHCSGVSIIDFGQVSSNWVKFQA